MWPPPRPLTFKPRKLPRLYSIREFDVDNGNSVIAVFQGNRGQRPDLDIIVKYLQRGKQLRTPRHIHWVIDLLVKKQHNTALTYSFVKHLIDLYDGVDAFYSENDRLERTLVSDSNRNNWESFSDLNAFGEYSIEFTHYILELIAIQEKTSNPNAFMFRDVLSAIRDEQEIFKIVSLASHRG